MCTHRINYLILTVTTDALLYSHLALALMTISLSLSLSLQTMKVFEHYPEDVLREISRDVRHDTFLANETCESAVCVCVLTLLIENQALPGQLVSDLCCCYVHCTVHYQC